VIERSREWIEDDEFKKRHCGTEKDFIRVRMLPFSLVLTLVMRKSMKSLQNSVNDALTWLNESTVTASAYSQARYKLKHTAFIELNREAVVKTMYSDDSYKTFWGFRVLAVDGSKLQLPDSEDVRKEFGTIAWKTTEQQGERPYALASVLYDVLNRVAIDADLGAAKAYEVDLAIAHLAHTQAGDLLIMDRNYPSYRMLAELTQHQRDFVIRCSAASFKEVRRMLKGEGGDSQVVTLTPCAEQLPLMKRLNLPTALTVRLVRVRLSTGEWEVLVTSLLDDIRYPCAGFLELYGLRWGIETFFGVLKTRLELENFSGTRAEAVKQDFYAVVYLSGMESLLTESAQTQLDAKNTQYPQTVNRAVSFNAIKYQALDLLFSNEPLDPLLEKLTALFLSNPCLARKHRKPPRKKSSARVSLNYQKRQKKRCF